MERITRKHLERLCEALNRATNSPMEPWTTGPDGRLTANIGNYHISGAYGGWQIQRMGNTGGGITGITPGYRPARQVYDIGHAYLLGIHHAQQNNSELATAAPEMLAALKRALPWLGFIVAHDHHINCAAPTDAVNCMKQVEHLIEKLSPANRTI